MTGSILLSIGFLVAMGIVLAGLLVLAEQRILNYGTCKVTINDGAKELSIPGGGSLLSSLAENDIFVPSACGGRGSCAYCKVTVHEGGGVITPVEEPYLSDEERKKNIRLSCQVKVRNDIQISIPKELFSVKRYDAKLERKRALTHDILELRIALAEPPEIDFAAGQYIQLESREYKGRDSVMRAYSISSPPSDNNHLELIVRKVPDGICTTWIFDHLNEGDPVRLSGPYGEFHISNTDAPIIFIAGGSGMAPIWSMLRDMKEHGNQRKATYFFGALSQNDLFFRGELQNLEQEMPWFTYVPALSREPADSDWQGERGLITDVVAGHFPDCSAHEAYLCGSPGMIDACVKALTKGNMPEEKIYYDKFA
ncbi:MAG: 2Fe-2S iron-sulfur cluster binding domain-containing protein [Chitinivibrionales bacterium]|nr:2Fe-2S iron-sulfur cluster binding domain-containing protein [Chitinivibrionales bacterium]MBD3358027.1 2Fe-2S iron-sulfur cluster binding domain-containing protein [Chitinivibrionales bacterium]